MRTPKINPEIVIEIVLISAVTALAVSMSVIAFHYLEGWLFLISAVILTAAAIVSNVAIMNRRTNKDDLVAGIAKFNSDHSYRFYDQDPTCEALNGLFDQIQSNDEKNRILIRNISHEVKTPLTGLKVIAEGVMDGVFEPDAEHMKAILDDVRRIDETLSVMKKYSDIMDTTNQIDEHGDVVKTLMAAYERAKRAAGGDVEITLRKNAKNGFKTHVGIDDQSLETLFDIAIGNCFEHAKGMSRLEISLDGMKVRQQEYVKVSIADDGCGMTKEELARIKDAFSKSDEARTVSSRSKTTLGLGLNIADTIVKRSGGSMSVSAKENVGTCVSFILPTTK